MTGNNGEETQITRTLLKTKSGEFDLESIYSLELVDLSIKDLGCIGGCTALETLNLSKNSIIHLLPLAGLPSLTHLDLSSNKISNLDGLQMLSNLISLNVAGNLISSCDILKVLSGLEKLDELKLKDLHQGLTNPICLNVQYKNQALALLPKLVFLDGEKLTERGSDLFKLFAEMDRMIEDIQATVKRGKSITVEADQWVSSEVLDLKHQMIRSLDHDVTLSEDKLSCFMSECHQLMQAFDEKMATVNHDLSQVS